LLPAWVVTEMAKIKVSGAVRKVNPRDGSQRHGTKNIFTDG